IKPNIKHRVVVHIDAQEYISLKTGGATDVNTMNQVKKDVESLYSDARDAFNEEYTCNIEVTIIDARYIVVVLQAQGYSE
ncbi:MAG: hypothetical protein J6Q15_02765, partial [Clostridia bacterium]|nr:hypothetical protein [Clostridia bacterium]